jgi:ADP-ribose pyrophosphatase
MPEAQQRGPWKVRGEREIYRDSFVTLQVHDVTRPDGSDGTYAVVGSPDGLLVVALTEDNQVYLVGQHRYAADEYSWELPTGGVEEGESPQEGAARELREEAGLKAERWTSLGRVHPSGSIWASFSHLYLAQNLTECETDPDPSEEIEVRKLPLEDALEEAASGKITHAATIVALFRAWRYVNGKA